MDFVEYKVEVSQGNSAQAMVQGLIPMPDQTHMWISELSEGVFQ